MTSSKLGKVALVDLGRSSALGAQRRIATLVKALKHIGYDVSVVTLLPQFKASKFSALARLPEVTRNSNIVPETLAWSPRAVRAHLEDQEPTIVISVTARCFHPTLIGPWRTYIDFVDQLSVSYQDRSTITASKARSTAFRFLARQHALFERSIHTGVSGSFAAGRTDAEKLGATWVRIHVDNYNSGDPEATDNGVVDEDTVFDVGFVGTLDYPPNVDAILTLDRMWQSLSTARPGTTALIAGARPSAEVVDVTRRNGWMLMADFPSHKQVLSRFRVALAPLRHASGLQTKVLDAAMFGIPQVVSPVVASGLDEEFPLLVCGDREEWITTISRLLADPDEARDLGERSRTHVMNHYSLAAAARDIDQVLTEEQT